MSGYANRNVALRQALGDYVAYAQHDDLWFPEYLAHLLRAISTAGAEWAYSRPVWVGRNAAVRRTRRPARRSAAGLVLAVVAVYGTARADWQGETQALINVYRRHVYCSLPEGALRTRLGQDPDIPRQP